MADKKYEINLLGKEDGFFLKKMAQVYLYH